MKKPRRAKKTIPKTTKTKPNALSGDSLQSIYEQLKELLARHAPPFKLLDAGVRGKLSVQLVVPQPVTIPGSYGDKPVDLQMAAVILQRATWASI